LATLAGMESPRHEPIEVHGSVGALDEFLAMPRAQQQRHFAALNSAAQRGNSAAPLVHRLALAFGFVATPTLPAATSANSVLTTVAPTASTAPTTATSTPASAATTTAATTAAGANDGRILSAPPYKRVSSATLTADAMLDTFERPAGAHATIENMKEMLRQEQQNVSAGMQTLRAIPEQLVRSMNSRSIASNGLLIIAFRSRFQNSDRLRMQR
jgi:hypothetical protein